MPQLRRPLPLRPPGLDLDEEKELKVMDCDEGLVDAAPEHAATNNNLDSPNTQGKSVNSITARPSTPETNRRSASNLTARSNTPETHRRADRVPTTFSLQHHIHSDKETFSFLAEFSQEDGPHSKKQLLAYDLRKLVQVGGLLSMFCRGSVFRMDMAWAMDAANGMLVAVITALIAYSSDSASIDIIANLMYQASQLVPVVLGFYVSVAFGRWWQLREDALGSVFDALTDVTMMMGCALPEDDPVHEYVARMGLASIELLVKAARIEPGFESLILRGLLTAEECDLLEPSSPFQRVFMCWAWILRVTAERLNDKGPRAAALYGKCMQAKQGILLVQKSSWSQLPFAYVHLQAWLVSAHNLIVGVRVGLGLAYSFEHGRYAMCVGEIFMGVVICVIYRGVLCITHLIHDPFGPGSMGFPIMAYTGYVAASIDAVQLAYRKCPAVERLRQAEEGVTRV